MNKRLAKIAFLVLALPATAAAFGKLYIAMGQPYNVPPKRKMGEFNKWGIGGIIRMNLDGSITRGIEIIVAVASVTANRAESGRGPCGTTWPATYTCGFLGFFGGLYAAILPRDFSNRSLFSSQPSLRAVSTK
jgi:hypothetical protein